MLMAESGGSAPICGRPVSLTSLVITPFWGQVDGRTSAAVRAALPDGWIAVDHSYLSYSPSRPQPRRARA
jgi:hypothetical protein